MINPFTNKDMNVNALVELTWKGQYTDAVDFLREHPDAFRNGSTEKVIREYITAKELEMLNIALSSEDFPYFVCSQAGSVKLKNALQKLNDNLATIKDKCIIAATDPFDD